MAAYFFTYNGKNNISVTDFIDPTNRLFFQVISNDSFLKYDNNTGLTNAKRIYDVYDNIEKNKYEINYQSFSLPYIKPGTDLLLPTDQITIENVTLYGDNQFLTQKNFTTYWSDHYNNLINDPLFVKTTNLSLEGQRVDVQIIHENLKVYVWIAALNQTFDISSFINRMTTSKNFEVGTFTITLNPVLNSIDPTNDILDNYLDSGLDTINYYPINNQLEGATKDFFETNLQMNDLIFLRYETLALETIERGEIRDLRVGNNELPGQIWDMIGLIDTVSTTRTNQTTDKIIQIAGRDLMKLLIDDASYFIPTIFRNGSDLSFIYSGNENESYFKRNFINGAYQYYFNYGEKNIKDSIGFIINHLANLKIVDDNLFDSYGDQISTKYIITGADQNYLEKLDVKGIWKIIKLFVDPIVDDRRIADDALANPDGSLLNYIKRICQNPFVEFYGDTNLDQYDFIARQAPLTGSAIKAIVGSGATNEQDGPINGGYINILEKDTISYTLDWETRYYSWFQIQAQNIFMGNSDASSLSIIPIIWLPPYVEKFGNKRYIIQDNYFSSRSLKGDEDTKELNINLFALKVLNDLKYIIDIHAYLPFTRRGTITLIGDRRIKIGTFVRLSATDELFYVTSVNNSIIFNKGAVERITTLTVERGMVIKYINGIYEPEGFPTLNAGRAGRGESTVVATRLSYNYFNIVDTNLIITTIIRNLEQRSITKVTRGIATDFGVNLDIFNFFEQRQQFKQ